MKMTERDREHHNKFIKLATDAGVKLPPLETFKLSSIGELLEKYKKDENLNNIPLFIFDNLYHYLPAMPGKAPYYGACIYKALLRQLLIDKGLLNNDIAISNRFIMVISEAKRLNNWLDCDVIQDAIKQAEKLRDSIDNEKRLDAIDYLQTAVNFRNTRDRSTGNYFNRLISEFKELIS